MTRCNKICFVFNISKSVSIDFDSELLNQGVLTPLANALECLAKIPMFNNSDKYMNCTNTNFLHFRLEMTNVDLNFEGMFGRI